MGKAVACADNEIAKSDESLVRYVGRLIYVPVIARCMARHRPLGPGATPTM
jgi:hypothetical protein